MVVQRHAALAGRHAGGACRLAAFPMAGLTRFAVLALDQFVLSHISAVKRVLS